MPKPNDSRARLASFANVLDTKSFILPVRRNLVWLWVGITIGLPILMSAAYFVLTHFLK